MRPPATPKALRQELTSYAAISATRGKRTDVEMRYFMFHKKNGARLRGKYRP